MYTCDFRYAGAAIASTGSGACFAVLACSGALSLGRSLPLERSLQRPPSFRCNPRCRSPSLVLGAIGRPPAARPQPSDDAAASPEMGAATVNEIAPADSGASPSKVGANGGAESRMAPSESTHDPRLNASASLSAGKPTESPAGKMEAAHGRGDALNLYGEWIPGDPDGQMQPGMEMMLQLETLIEQRRCKAVKAKETDVFVNSLDQLYWRTLLPLARREGLDLEEVGLPPFRRHRRSCYCCLNVECVPGC